MYQSCHSVVCFLLGAIVAIFVIEFMQLQRSQTQLAVFRHTFSYRDTNSNSSRSRHPDHGAMPSPSNGTFTGSESGYSGSDSDSLSLPLADKIPASFNIKLLHDGFIKKLLTFPLKPLTVGVVGGSISEGHGSGRDGAYGAQFVQYLNTRWPTADRSPHVLINKALRASTMRSTMLCLDTMFKSAPHIDLVFIEFAINSEQTPFSSDDLSDNEMTMHPSADLERIIRYWLQRSTPVMWIEMRTIGSYLALPSMFSPVAAWYGVPIIDFASMIRRDGRNPVWKDLYLDRKHPLRSGAMLVSNLIIQELEFHMQLVKILKRSKPSAGPSGPLADSEPLLNRVVPRGPFSLTAAELRRRLPTKWNVQIQTSDAYTDTDPSGWLRQWHGLDVFSLESALQLDLDYQSSIRDPLIPGRRIDFWKGRCYMGDYGWHQGTNVAMNVSRFNGWAYGEDPFRQSYERGHKVGWYSKQVGSTLEFFLPSVWRTVGIIYLRTWKPCGAVEIQLGYVNGTGQVLWPGPAAAVMVACSARMEFNSSTAHLHLINVADILGSSTAAAQPAVAPFSMILRVISRPVLQQPQPQPYQRDSRNAFFMLYGYVVD